MTVLPAAALASHTPTGEPFDQDFVDATFFTGVANLTIDARSGPSGENPTGEATADDGVGTDTGSVTCLYVSANRATVGVDFAAVGGGWFFLEDSNGAGPDSFAGVGTLTGEAPTACPPESPRALTAVAGDIVVHDTQPFPTSRDQCKNDGWRNYGTTFKNQGECVSFVATGGKNPPDG
jgi:hypothetical protein